MAKSKKSRKAGGGVPMAATPGAKRSLFGLESRFVLLILYLSSSAIYFLWSSPLIFACFWLLSFLFCQFRKDELERFHAQQSAAVNILAFALRLLLNSVIDLVRRAIEAGGGGEAELLQAGAWLGWISLGISLVVLALQVFGAESAMRGAKLKLPLAYRLGEIMGRFFLPSAE